MDIEVSGDKTLVKSIECIFDNHLHCMLFIEINLVKGARIVVGDAVLQPGSDENYYQANHYRPLRVEHTARGNSHTADILLYPRRSGSWNEDCLVDNDHFFASTVSGTCHKLMVVPKEISSGSLALRWNQEEGRTY